MRRLMFWQKQTPDTPRRTMRQFSWPHAKKAAIGGVSLGAVCLMAGLWMERDAILQGGYDISAEQGFALADLHITGRNYTSDDELKAAIGAGYGTPLLSLSLSDIQHNLQQLGWVKSARVSRVYPDALRLDLVERRPLALLQTAAGHRLIDETGALIFGANPAEFSHLPVLSGDGAAEQAKFIIESLRTEPDLYADVWAIQRVSNRRWDVHLRTGLSVKLPEDNAVLAWSKLAILDRDTKIMKRDLAVIDMRVSGQLIVEPNLPLSKKGQKT